MTSVEKTNIAKRACTIIFANEGNYGSVNKNDNGAVSVGKIQWHAQRAKQLLQAIINANTNQALNILGQALYSEILSSSNWNARIVNSSEADKLSRLLSTVEGKKAQDDLAVNDVLCYVNRGISYGLTNAEALIYFADGVNQYGEYSSLWKNITAQAVKSDGGSLDAMYNATVKLTSNYLARRKKVYDALKGAANTAQKPAVQAEDKTVSEIQKWLNGYCNAGLVVDGCCGPKTKAALIKALQHCMNVDFKRNLAEDGSYGPLSRAACNGIMVSTVMNKKGSIVRIVQAMLYVHGNDPKGIDGSFGLNTKAAVLTFQAANNLVKDGVVGPKTFEKLVK